MSKTNYDTTPVLVELSTGATIPLRPTRAKSGNIYHAILKADGQTAAGKFGRKVQPSVVGGAIPESVTVFGERIQGTVGTTQSGNPKRSYTQRLKVEGLGERVLHLSISELSDGNFNVVGALTRPGGNAGGKAAAESL